MTDISPSASGVAERYASALFDLAREEKALERTEADLNDLGRLIDESDDLRRLVTSPAFSAEEHQRAMAALMEKGGSSSLTANFVGLVARNRRLFALPGIIKAFRARMARHRGEMRADVVSAQPLSDEQREALKTSLTRSLGKEVSVDVKVDPAILGGLIVQVGSRQIDSSLRSRLDSMKVALKEVG